MKPLGEVYAPLSFLKYRLRATTRWRARALLSCQKHSPAAFPMLLFGAVIARGGALLELTHVGLVHVAEP